MLKIFNLLGVSKKVRLIKLLILDIDGTLTNGKLYGNKIRFDVRDGLGLKMIQELGINICVISGRKSECAIKRLEELGIDFYFLDIRNKEEIVKAIKSNNKSLKYSEIAYIGDDINDIEAMRECGFKVAVNNASRELKKISNYVTKAKGGNGAVREVCDLILKYKIMEVSYENRNVKKNLLL